MSLIINLIYFVVISLIYFAFYKLNFKKQIRFKNIAFPILLSICFLLFTYFYFKYLTEPFANGLLAFDEMQDNIDYYFNLSMFVIILFIFLFLKTISSLLSKIILRIPSVAYERSEINNQVYLKSEWFFVKMFFKYTSYLAALLFVVAIIFNYYGIKMLPIYIGFSLLLCLEWFWYLDGNVSSSYKEVVYHIDPANADLRVDYTKLFEKYIEVWEENTLVSWNTSNKVVGSKFVEKPTDGFIKNLMSKGYRFNEQDLTIFDKLTKNKDILITSPVYEQFSPTFFAALYKKLLDGEKILFLTNNSSVNSSEQNHQEIKNWITKNIQRVSGIREFSKPRLIIDADFNTIESSIVISTTETLLKNSWYENFWFSDLHVVVILNYGEFYSSEIASLNILVGTLKDKNNSLQLIILNNFYRDSVESSVKSVFKLNHDFSEYRYFYLSPLNSKTIIYRSDSDVSFQSKILIGHIPKFLGEETCLSLLAWKESVSNIKLYGLDGLPIIEYLEEIQNNAGVLCFQTSHISRSLDETVFYTETPYLESITENGVICCRDNFNNVPLSLRHYESYNKNQSLTNVVVRPYMLREYFIKNLAYFYLAPFDAIAPILSETKFSAAYLLLWKMISSSMSVEQISEIINRFTQPEEHTFDAFIECKDLLTNSLNITNIESYIKIDTQLALNSDGNKFHKIKLFSLNQDVLNNKSLDFQKSVRIVAENGITLRIIQFDFLFQNYLFHQIHEFGGKPYCIDSFDDKNYVLNVHFGSPNKIVKYHACRNVRMKDSFGDKQNLRTEKQNTNFFHISIIETEFIVQTKGYYHFRDDINLIDNPQYYSCNNVPERKYKSGRLIKIDFNRFSYSKDDLLLITNSLVALINEVITTLFPETHQYLICAAINSSLNEDSSFLKDYYPKLSIMNSNKVSNVDEKGIFIFEDVHQDLGLTKAFLNNFEKILHLLDDYIEWELNESSDPMINKNALYNNIEIRGDYSDKYFFFGKDTMPEYFDFNILKEFFKKIISNNQLTKARHDFNSGKTTMISNIISDHFCDFCSKNMSLSEIETLDDGRERCLECKKEAINTEAQLKSVFKDASKYFKQLFKQNMPKDINVIFTDAANIQSILGTTLIITPGFDERAVGVAVDKTIMIENGAPYSRTLSTIIHELTHVWQSQNLNIIKMQNDMGLLLIEGHAVWASIEVLAHLNIAQEYRNHYFYRNDEYGNGLKEVLKMLKANNINNAFELFKSIYPFN